MKGIRPSADTLENKYEEIALEVLKGLIRIPSLSKEEKGTADYLERFLTKSGVTCQRSGNNVWATNQYFDPKKPTALLNSHHDTVKPNAGYTLDPFTPVEREGKLYGLGSNDAGGCLVALVMTFLHFYGRSDLPYNLVFAGTAEEENSGTGGVESILPELGSIDFGVVGEPTEMKMGMAEKGLMVLDCQSQGISGHAARNKGVNAIYEALSDIEWFRNFSFPETSPYLGDVKMSVTMISAGYQHNVIPDTCDFVVDVRTTECYSNEEALAIIKEHVKCSVTPRSTRLGSSRLPDNHQVSRAADALGIEKFGSPTTSDQAVMGFPTFKMGPGKSERSHTPDEYIYVGELGEGIRGYIRLLESLFKSVK